MSISTARYTGGAEPAEAAGMPGSPVVVEPARAAGEPARTVGAGRAARELTLRRGEFDLAAQLGFIRTVPGGSPGRRLVSRGEIDRLRGADGFPDALRERVRTVDTAGGAELLAICPRRFARLARAGFVAPVGFRLNRYRAVVWLYLAAELGALATAAPALFRGRLPTPPGAGLRAGEDRRPRNWRGRRTGHLLHETQDPWERAAVVAGVLGEAQVAELVRDPYERAYLHRLRPRPVPGRTESEAARTVVRRLLLADHPDEIRWHRASLSALADEARGTRPAPRPGSRGGPPGGGTRRCRPVGDG